VQKGILALKTPEMKACIQKSFANDGFFTLMRSDDMQLAAQLQVNLAVVDSPAISDEVENDENVEEVDYDANIDGENECN
jgi:hypothetical protein